MAYTPINWQTGDTITAEKMNKMDNGWDVGTTELFSETVTTADDEGTNYGSLAYASLIDAATITVTFDGTDYTCNNSGSGEYGAQWSDTLQGYDFSTYPFNITSWSDPSGAVGNDLVTETAGTHTVAAITQGIETSSRFDAAVNKAVVKDGAFEVISGTTTWQEVHDALMAGKYVYTVDEYGESGDTITSVGHALRTDAEGHEVMFANIMGNTNPSLNIFYLAASSADGVLG